MGLGMINCSSEPGLGSNMLNQHAKLQSYRDYLRIMIESLHITGLSFILSRKSNINTLNRLCSADTQAGLCHRYSHAITSDFLTKMFYYDPCHKKNCLPCDDIGGLHAS